MGRRKKNEDEQPETLDAETPVDDGELDWDDEEEDDAGDDIEDDEPSEETVSRPLNKAQVREREVELATTSRAIFDLEDKRTEILGKITRKLKELKKKARSLGQQIEDEAERVPAQQALFQAKTARRKAERGKNQDNGAVVSAE